MTGRPTTGSDPEPAVASSPGDGLAQFEAERGRLWGVAYRVVGTTADADEVVQDAWLRWQQADRDAIANPAAWLTTVVGRLALDRLRSARHRRETYVGPWLPEPIGPGRLDDIDRPLPADPARAALLAESLTIGFMAVLEKLSPVERVVLLLHDVFGVPFDEVARTVDRSPAATRQVAVRARSRVQAERRRFAPAPADLDRLSEAFGLAAATGDLSMLEDLLSEDVVLISDAGADVHAARRPVVGRARVARFVVNISRRLTEAGSTTTPTIINGQPGVYIHNPTEADTAIVITWIDGRADSIMALRNPEKLRSLSDRGRSDRAGSALASEGDGDRWAAAPLDDGEQALMEIADWGPAEDWSDWVIDAPPWSPNSP